MKERFIAQVGLGYWGKNILRVLHGLGVLHTACDNNSTLISEYLKKYPDTNFTTSFDVILKHPEIRAVVIATPAVMHYEMAKLALLSGKDVYVEKPLALNIKDAQELIELAENNKKILMVGHILQYHPAVKKMKEIISSGRLGKIQYIYSNRLNIGKVRTEENILWSFAPHDISLILMLTGEEPIKVSSFGGDYINKGIYDITLTTLEFRNGVKGHIFVSWLHPYKEQKLIVVGSKAMLVFDDLSKEKLFLYSHKIEWKNGKIPIAEKAECEVIPVDMEEPLVLEMKHFIECVLERKRPVTDGYEALRVLKVLDVAERSLGLNSLPIIHQAPQYSYKNVYIHETVYIDENVEIGEGTKIWHFSHILRNSKIGKDCVIGQNVAIGPDVLIGNRCKIQNNVSVFKGVTLEDEVFCGPSCVFTNVSNPRAFLERKHEFKQTLVKKGATIGANATILCGVTIGKYAMVGAGAVVTKDIEDYALVVGVPAEQIGWVCKCGNTLKFNNSNRATCFYCGNDYILEEKKVIPVNED